ncbi:MAG: hypothetical protein ACOCV7_03660, partial [Desulfonatronovibrionaceae bacterium]
NQSGGNMFKSDSVQPVYNEQGHLLGVYISAQVWLEHQTSLEEVLFSGSTPARSRPVSEPVEPMSDWEQFLSFWDFNYPVEKEVRCEHCGESTPDWTADHPRKFVLKAASLGGLVAFQCASCSYRVSKKHFKDHICYECTPCNCQVG